MKGAIMESNCQYLYQYRNGKRIRNIGLIQIESQMDKSTIKVYAKQMDVVKGILFEKESGETYIGSWEAELMPVEEVDMARQEVVEEYVTSSRVKYEKIQRQDLSRLPRREWKLANNSFLLHGFTNYHHLLYIEDEGNIWIGVPGIYHEKEQMAALAFGFGTFRRMIDVEIELEEEEKNTIEDFGYWCRQILVS